MLAWSHFCIRLAGRYSLASCLADLCQRLLALLCHLVISSLPAHMLPVPFSEPYRQVHLSLGFYLPDPSGERSKWLWMMMVNLSVHIGWWRPRIHISKPLDLNDRVVRVRLYNRSNFKTYSDNLVAGILFFYFFKLQLYLFYFLAYFVYSFIFFDSSLAVHCFE